MTILYSIFPFKFADQILYLHPEVKSLIFCLLLKTKVQSWAVLN